MPARRKRSKRCTRTFADGRVTSLTGQPRPTQRTLTVALLGPRIDSRVIRAPVRAKKPRMRTTGNGCRNGRRRLTEDEALIFTGTTGAAVGGGGAGGGCAAGGGVPEAGRGAP